MTSLWLQFPEISSSHLHEIVSDKFQYRKLCACWVPKVLTKQHKLKLRDSAVALSDTIQRAGVWLPDPRIHRRLIVGVTCNLWNEITIHELESHFVCNNKIKQTFSTRNIIWTDFKDRKAVLVVDLLSQCSTINSNVCCETLTSCDPE